MKKLILSLLCISLLSSCSINFGRSVSILSFSSKAYDNAPKKEIKVKNFNSITNEGPLQIYYAYADKPAVVLEGDTALFNKVQTKQEGSSLTISMQPGTYHNLWLRITIYSNDIKEINQTGSGDIICKTLKLGHDLDLNEVGSGDIRINQLICDELDAEVCGSGSIYINNIKANEADLNIIGSGSTEINGSITKVDADVTGSGSIYGNLSYQKIKENKTGSGDIKLSKK